jgi:hypothetical protein
VVLIIEPIGANAVNVSGVWKQVNEAFVKVSGSWKDIDTIYVKVNNSWREVSGAGQGDLTLSASSVDYGTITRSYT